MLLRAAIAFALAASPAYAYDRRDAGYVTASKNPTILAYIVCLEKHVQRNDPDMERAIGRAAITHCKEIELAWPLSPVEPRVVDI